MKISKIFQFLTTLNGCLEEKKKSEEKMQKNEKKK